MDENLKKAIDDYQKKVLLLHQARSKVMSDVKDYCEKNKLRFNDLQNGNYDICGKLIDISTEKFVNKFSADNSAEDIEHFLEKYIIKGMYS